MTSDGARRAEILETAATLFASSGLRTTLKDIADACGILPGSLYHHFDSKEAIVIELVGATARTWTGSPSRPRSNRREAGPSKTGSWPSVGRSPSAPSDTVPRCC